MGSTLQVTETLYAARLALSSAQLRLERLRKAAALRAQTGGAKLSALGELYTARIDAKRARERADRLHQVSQDNPDDEAAMNAALRAHARAERPEAVVVKLEARRG